MRKSIRFLIISLLAIAVVHDVALADPYADMAKVQKAFYGVHSFRGQINTPKLNKPIVLEFVAPDRFHLTMPVGEQYIIGNTMYLHINGATMKLPAQSMTAMLGNVRTFAANEDVRKNYTVAYTGTKLIGGQTLRMYTYSKKTDPSMRVKMFIGADNLPRRNEVTGKDGTITVITYKDYNAPITINP